MADSQRQTTRSNVVIPPAEIVTTINTTAADQLKVLDGDGLRQWCLTVSCPQAVIIDVEEGNDPSGAVWLRAKNDDGVTLPLTIAANTPTIIRGVKYGRCLRLKIKRSTVDGAAAVHLYAQ